MDPQIRIFEKGLTYKIDNRVVIGFNQLWIDVETLPCVLPLVAAVQLGVNLPEDRAVKSVNIFLLVLSGV